MKVLGIIALVLSMSSLGAPLFLGGFLSALSGGGAIFTCKNYKYFALASMVINVINLIVISPQKIAFDIQALGVFIYFFLIVLFIQIIGVVIYINNDRKIKQVKA